MKDPNKSKIIKVPTVSELEDILEHEKYLARYLRMITQTIFVLITVASVSILIATLVFPVVQIYGTSMTPTLTSGDVVVSVANTSLKRGDIIAFYHNNEVLAKRVIAFSGEWVDIDESGNVYVNSDLLSEPYLTEKAFGNCNIDLPYQVPEGTVFVMGDHRSVSMDSRDSSIGSIPEELIVGKLVFRVWPFTKIGMVR
jgi:signal peptidase I